MNEFENFYDDQLAKSYLIKIVDGLYMNKDNTKFKNNFGITSINIKKNERYMSVYYYTGDFTIAGVTYTISTDYGIQVESKGDKSVPSIFDKQLDDITYNLTGDAEKDLTSIKKLVKEFSKLDPEEFKRNDYVKYPLDLQYHGPICNDVPFALFLIDTLGYSQGFIDKDEHSYLSDVFHLGKIGVRDKIVEHDMFKCFDSSFKVLKENNFTVDDNFTYNDLDNHMAYLERDGYQGITYESQNHLFIVVKELLTNRMKAWATMKYNSSEGEDLLEDLSFGFKEENKFNVIDYLVRHCNEQFNASYVYIDDFEHPKYRKHFSFYFNNFDFSGNDCVFDSKYGFQTAFRLRNSLVFEVRVGNDNLLEEMGEEETID